MTKPKSMKVKDLIAKLKKMPQNCDVTISDGYKFLFYRGDFKVTQFDKKTVDIGIGGMEEKEDETA